jgi:protein-tyrosine phosphatase
MLHPLRPSQQSRLAAFDVAESVDLHCHCLPGLDDGPETMDQAVALCRALVADGITAVVATPHQLGRYDLANHGRRVRGVLAQLVARLDQEGIPLKLYPGADVRLDERILKLIDVGQVLTVANRRAHLLLELPHETFIEPLPLVRRLMDRGFQSVITHPERQPMVCRRSEIVLPWINAGAILQVTAGSLLGEFGSAAQKIGWEFLSAGLPVLIASDAHGTGPRPPCMTGAIEAIRRRLGAAAARRACIDYPLRILRGLHCGTTISQPVGSARGGEA